MAADMDVLPAMDVDEEHEPLEPVQGQEVEPLPESEEIQPQPQSDVPQEAEQQDEQQVVFTPSFTMPFRVPARPPAGFQTGIDLTSVVRASHVWAGAGGKLMRGQNEREKRRRRAEKFGIPFVDEQSSVSVSPLG